jgi:hypothetical protein
MENRISRSRVAFEMTVPETGDVAAAFEITLRTADGFTHRFSQVGFIPKMLAGPIDVTMETMLTVPIEPPPAPLSLRQRLEATLLSNHDAQQCDQVSALLKTLSESPNLLDELEALTSDDRA